MAAEDPLAVERAEVRPDNLFCLIRVISTMRMRTQKLL